MNEIPNNFESLKQMLDGAYTKFACKLFIDNDPIQIPHSFTSKADIEIAGLFAATLAWGNRKSIISSLNKLLTAMGNSPYSFITNFTPADSKYLEGFVHRTFNATDAVAFVQSLQKIYALHGGLDTVFTDGFAQKGNIMGAIAHFRDLFVDADFPPRSAKHVSDIMRGSAAKRLNMYLRWMIRPNTEGVDFGIWQQIPTSALLIPLDVHASRVARKLGLLNRTQNDLKAVIELTSELQKFDPDDPVKYDFALFGLGVYGIL